MAEHDEFAKPSIPVPASNQSSGESRIQLDYQPPEWAAKPDLSMPRYFLECLKNGSSLGRQEIKLNNQGFLLIGRVPVCDLQLDHPSISRFHAILQLKKDGSLWFYDNQSSHGSILNKKPVAPREYHRLFDGDQMKFGASTRIFLLCGGEERPVDSVSSQKSASGTGNFFQKLQEKKKALQEVTWGMMEDDDYQEQGEGEQVDFEPAENASYRRDPQKSLRHWLLTNDHGEPEIQYAQEKTEGGETTVICKISLPFGNASFAYGDATTKKEALEKASLNACIQIDSRGLFMRADGDADRNRKRRRRHRDSEDEDEYYDRTSTQKRTSKSATGEHNQQPAKVKNLESLLEEERALKHAIELLNTELQHESKISDAEDDLDAYMNSLSHQMLEQKRSKAQKELDVKQQELKKVEELIEFLRPTWLSKDVKPKQLTETTEKTAESSGKTSKPVQESQPAKLKNPTRTVPSIPDHSPEKQVGPRKSELTRRNYGPHQSQPDKKEKKGEVVPKFDEDDDDAGVLREDDWVPPSNQSGDGTTNLNQRFGY